MTIRQLHKNHQRKWKSHEKLKTYRLSQSEKFVSNEYDNLTNSDNDNTLNSYNLINSDNNNIADECNNLINEESHLILEKFKNTSKLPNLNAIKLVSLIKHSGQSWIWLYYQCYKAILPYKTIVSCLVEIYRNTSKSELCGHIIGSVDSSTGNYIRHLATQHSITESSYNEKTKKSQPSQLQIDQMIYNNPECKRRKDQKFVEFLIKDHQPISIRNDEGLKDFIAEFDPSY
ncbi:19552_t:CDS:2 [Racocetra persica]|uniref:19552_t:CDS:1 n=1 Tax=Racocetra persica TaxID=160502 RepID=A0ACA9LM33_9GLOM|nr:19552_t:CDS:2 [Racocetra persica]